MANENQSLKAWLDNAGVTDKIVGMLGKKKFEIFKSTLLNIYQNNKQLQECDGRSILGAAIQATTSGLSLSPALGQAYIVPFKTWDKERRENVFKAQFQIGTRGLIQMAQRTGKYKTLHAGKICEGEVRGINPITGDIETGEKISDEVVGYIAFMRMTDGFENVPKQEIEAHALKYSQSYAYDKRAGKTTSPWSTNFDAMASKTVLKKLLRQWGELTTEAAEAIQADQSVVDRETFTYVDNGGHVQQREKNYLPDDTPAIAAPSDETVNIETGEIAEEIVTIGEVENGGASVAADPY